MVPEGGGTSGRSDRQATEGESTGALDSQQRTTPDQFGPITPEEIRAATLEVFTRTGTVRDRLFTSSPTAYTDTIADLVEAIEALADVVGVQYGVDAPRSPVVQSSVEPDS